MGLPLTIAIRLVEALFVVGVVGSALVILLTTIEDLETLFGSNESDGKSPTD